MKKDYNKLVAKANSIKNKGSILLIIISILVALIAVIFPIVHAVSFNNPYSQIPVGFTAIGISLSVVYLILIIVFSIVVTIELSSTDGDNDFLNNDKSTYCILIGAFLLTVGIMVPILGIIGGNKTKNIYHKLNEESKKQDDSKINNI